MNGMIKVIHIGLGPIGQAIARQAATHPRLQPVGGIDLAPDLVGRDLGDIIGLGTSLDAPVGRDWEHIAEQQPDIALHATGSRLSAVLPQLLEIVERRLSVISTCEELSYPWYHHADEAGQLDIAAKRAGVAVLGTGINPGFIMDALPLAASGVCSEVTQVTCRRVVNLSQRRRQLQQKVGVGYTVERFRNEAASGQLGHVGLPESVAMIAAGLGWTLDGIEQSLDPVVAVRSHESTLGAVPIGGVIGQHQIARGKVGGEDAIRLELVMALDAEDAGDFVQLSGPQPLSTAVHGIQGDVATASVVINLIPRLLAASSGLHTMLDLPMPHSRGRMNPDRERGREA